MRLFAQTATIENGFVHLPEAAHWLPNYLAEFMLFPDARYDDQVDSTAQAVAWAKQRPAAHAMLECYRRLSGRGGGRARARQPASNRGLVKCRRNHV
jgi:hypothetical protein